MNKAAMLLALLVLLAMPVASAANATIYLKPTDSIVPDGYGHTTDVEVWVDATNWTPPDGGTWGVNSIDMGIGYDPNCVELVDVDFTVCGWVMTSWNAMAKCHGPGRDYLKMWAMTDSLGDFHACTLTFHCNNSSCAYCETNLNFTTGIDSEYCVLLLGSMYMGGTAVPSDSINGTLTCGSVVIEPFSKPIYEGWNLISLPLVPEGGSSSASDVLSTVDYDAVYQYNATSKQFEAIESTDAMNPGAGYFVHATSDCTWEYSGTAYNSMSTPLEPGLNMVGWLNCSKDVDALSSISEDCYYVARWNTVAEKFEVYNPVAPSTFNDFATMERGTGYFISAKQDCTDCALSENC